jgi:propanol-preferring alcohol dehydrogenase
MELPKFMKAMVLEKPGAPLIEKQLPVPSITGEEVLVKIIACGVCRTDLHIADGDLKNPKLPLILGHEIIGTVVRLGKDVKSLKVGDEVGISWLGYTCGHCKYCRDNLENLCDNAVFTGYLKDGGYAEYTTVHHQYCFHMDPKYMNPAGAPLLCAGLIGYRSYRMMGPGPVNIGIYGFGAAAHILIQIAVFQGKKVFAFTRENDKETQVFARKLGAEWAGGSNEHAPAMLDAAIIFAPAGELVPKALRDTDKAGQVICGGIHMSPIPSFPYEILWEERKIQSVANLTRRDGTEFMKAASEASVKVEAEIFPLSEANTALDKMRKGKIRGAAVLVTS